MAAPAASLTWPTSVAVTAWPKIRGPDPKAIKKPHSSRMVIYVRSMEKPLFDAYLSTTELTHIRNGSIDVGLGRYGTYNSMQAVACKELINSVTAGLSLSEFGPRYREIVKRDVAR